MLDGSMERKAKGHTASFLKRQAQQLKKQLGIAHYSALDLASKQAGFSNWKHFLNSSSASAQYPQKLVRQVPSPDVLKYRIAFSTTSSKRPNAVMPLAAHLAIAKLLQESLAITAFHKRANKPIGDVRATLDDWLQNEYPNSKQLSDEEFHSMYYGHHGYVDEINPSKKQKQKASKLLEAVKEVLSLHYHDCQPVQRLLEKLDLALEWTKLWPNPQKSRTRSAKVLSAGTLIRTKQGKQLALVIEHYGYDDLVRCYCDSGNLVLSRSELVVVRNQAEAQQFWPMRLYIPYGKWSCEDGSEVLFNRDYQPLWIKNQMVR
ncbi:hypothetical protein BWI97_26210 [Siphonobacter sp. BAB-5405]|nr:hypothetical protein BWI97_26210 [Siphonobacter sp. BAB-5405]